MPATAERPPFVWLKLHTQASFCKLLLGGHVDVADLAAAAGARCGVGLANLELFLAAPPSAQPPLPAAIAAALLCDPLPVYANLLDAGALLPAPGCLRACLPMHCQPRRQGARPLRPRLRLSRLRARPRRLPLPGSARPASPPQSAPLEEVLGALPAPDPFDASLAWRSFAAAHGRMPRAQRKT